MDSGTAAQKDKTSSRGFETVGADETLFEEARSALGIVARRTPCTCGGGCARVPGVPSVDFLSFIFHLRGTLGLTRASKNEAQLNGVPRCQAHPGVGLQILE